MSSPSSPLVLERPMPSVPPRWAHAVWVGSVQLEDLERATGATVALAGADGHATARLLLRDGLTVLGFLEAPISDGTAALDGLRQQASALARLRGRAVTADVPTPPVTVIICTRDRPEQLRAALRSVLALDYPAFDVLVVDNASATGATRDLVHDEFGERVRLIAEPVPGLARARNTGLSHATGDVVAFTDDDVLVDPLWLRGVAGGFAAAPDVLCVSGLVPSGELRTPVQAYFDDRVLWSRNVDRRVYSLAAPPPGSPLFPFSVGDYGTGANFALRRSGALALGGFDTAFGVGTRTGGGEDLDLFTRVLLAGGTLVVEPAAVVWHRHRAELDGLARQTKGYGRGLGAWLTKVAVHPRTLGLALRRAPGAVVRLAAKRRIDTASTRLPGVPAPFPPQAIAEILPDVERLARYELRCVFEGPGQYLLQRVAGEGLLPGPLRAGAGGR